jgi:hypothetical protein
VMSTLLWTTSNIRFDAEMGGLLAMWMAVSFVASETLLPALILLFKPKFIMRESAPSAGAPTGASTVTA